MKTLTFCALFSMFAVTQTFQGCQSKPEYYGPFRDITPNCKEYQLVKELIITNFKRKNRAVIDVEFLNRHGIRNRVSYEVTKEDDKWLVLLYEEGAKNQEVRKWDTVELVQPGFRSEQIVKYSETVVVANYQLLLLNTDTGRRAYLQ